MPKYEPLPAPEPLPPLEPLPTPEVLPPAEQKVQDAQMAMPLGRQAMGAIPVAPPPVQFTPPPPTPAAPILPTDLRQAPPPQLANSTEDSGIVKRRKSKRQELQQASGGTDALRIKLNKSNSIGSAKSGSTGSSGLNIPK